MIESSNKYFMMIEPQGIDASPIDDELTQKAEQVLASCTLPDWGDRYKGFHDCCCGERSSNCDHFTKGANNK